MSQRIGFVSDLHLLSTRSCAHRHVDDLVALAERSDALVLGGDIFDFRWSVLDSIEASIDAAAEWMEELCRAVGDCTVHYVLGNHDYVRPFLTRLHDGLTTCANFAWQPFHLRLGRSIFLHGDVADRMMNAEALAARRAKCLEKQRAADWRHRLYDLAVMTRVHVPWPYLLKPARPVARRVLHYLRHVGHGPEHGVTDVYFGHTHVPMTDYRHGGLTFHNAGASIHGVRFQMLEARA